MDTTNLNYDTLLHIISLSNGSTQLRLIETCKSLYKAGAKYVLSGDTGGPYLRTEAQVVSFLLFMCADSGSRMRHLKDLTLAMEYPLSMPLAKFLVDWFMELSKHNRLVGLCLLDSENVLSSHVQLPGAIAQLTSIEKLTLEGAGQKAWAMVKALRSQLVEAEILFGDLDEVTLPARIDLLDQFAHSQTTLQHLDVRLPDEDMPVIEPWINVPTPCYERVRKLKLRYPLTDTSSFVRAFPNLKDLDLEYGCLLPYLNESEIRGNRSGHLRINGSWDLDAFAGTLLELYLLSTRSQIKTLWLYDEYEEVDLSILREVLADARPSNLRLTIRSSNTTDHFMNKQWMAVLSEARSPQISTLHIEVRFLDEHCDPQAIESAMASLCETIAGIKLRELSFIFNLVEVGGQRGCADPIAGTYFENFALSNVADFIGANVPSLSALRLHVIYPGNRLPETLSLGHSDAEPDHSDADSDDEMSI